MAYFDDDKVSRLDRLRLKHIDEWFQEYATDELLGEELEPGPMGLGTSVQPTVISVWDIDELDVFEAEFLGDGVIEVGCCVLLRLELDLNDDDQNTQSTEATMVIALKVNTRERKIVGHHLQDACAPDY
jgi:hypothetical protein